MRTRRATAFSIVSVVSVVFALAVTSAACSSSRSAAGSTAAPPAAAGSDLSHACPKTVVFQTGYFPDSTQDAVYNLLGDGYTVDSAKKAVTGTLVDGGRSTGVRVEIRSGGPAIGFAPVAQQMYVDKSILVGDTSTDDGIVAAKDHPVVAVVAPLNVSPDAIMWDPASHPQWSTISDIGKSGATVLYHQGSATIDYLLGTGLLTKAQADGSYDGTPARFVASGGKLAFEGYSTNEPYLYQHVFKQWGKPLKYQLLNDTGFVAYPANTLTVRKADLTGQASCLKLLVPMIQRSIAATIADPSRADRIVVDVVAKENIGYLYPADQAAYCSTAMKSQHLVGNGTGGTVGTFDPARISSVIAILKPILAAAGTPIAPGLSPDAIATNRFIDPSISAS